MYVYSAFPREDECVSPDIIDSDARVRNADVAVEFEYRVYNYANWLAVIY